MKLVEKEPDKKEPDKKETFENVQLPVAQGALKDLKEWMDSTAFIPQEGFTFAASLVLMGTLIGRKFTFRGTAPNLYILNVAPSGSGKDNALQRTKEVLSAVNAEHLLGAGDYVSDASLMDSLGTSPVRLDIMDECGGILRSMTKGKAEYNGKMADILAELYTSSNSRYLGRATAEGNKGACNRPNVNILGATTPTGLSEGISLTAIEKGLVGRMLMFIGDGDKPAREVKSKPKLDIDLILRLRYFAGFKPEESESEINGIKQEVYEIQSTKKADAKLSAIFKEFDDLRRATKHNNPLLPIIARLFQQMTKITMIHAASRTEVGNFPLVDIQDVEFAYRTILYYFRTIKSIVRDYIHEGPNDRITSKVTSIIKSNSPISKSDLTRATRSINKHQRDYILNDLIDIGDVAVSIEAVNGRNQQVITWVGEE